VPTFSIITPSNSVDWLLKAWPSVRDQTDPDWEWVVLMNNVGMAADCAGGFRRLMGSDDMRVKIIQDDALKPLIGLLKHRACEIATGTYIVELDHDDELSIDCLAELRAAFELPSHPVFVFSDYMAVHPDGSPHYWNPAYGWSYRNMPFRRADGTNLGTNLTAAVPDYPASLLPQHVAQIWFAPNHVRAWRADTYRLVGGHDVSLSICDDLDLMCKLYVRGTFHHIPRPLYRYLRHDDNTWPKNQALINQKNAEIYARNIEGMALYHARLGGLEALDLGGGISSPMGWTSVDVHDANIMANLNKRWPFKDSSVGVIRAYDVIEHLVSPIHVMNEAYRVLVHGGLFIIEVPSTDGRGAFQDPSHVSFWNVNSFWYFTKSTIQRYIKHLGAKCRFQSVHVLDHYPSEWHRTNKIVYTRAHLAAIKDGPRLHGIVEI